MTAQQKAVLCASLIAVAALAGCANPADDKPQAKVGEAVTTPPASTPAAEPAQRYTIADGSSIAFVGSKVTRSHDGGFKVFSGEIMLAGGDASRSSVSVRIDTDSLWADDERLTGHLKSPDFFDVATFPTATFESTSIEPTDTGYTITGNLDLHGVTKSIAFPATIEVGPGQVTAQAEFAIKRFDFGIVYPGAADDLIRDDVVIRLNLIAVPAV